VSIVIYPATMQWELLVPLGNTISPRSGTSVSQQGDTVYLFGGYTIKGHSSDLFSYNIRENYFEEILFQSVNPIQKAYHQSILYRNGLIIWGGKSKKDISSSIFRIDLGEKAIDQDEISKDFNKPRQSKYINQMKGMLYNRKLSDVCFEVQGQEFPCHRIVLAARCKYFDNMFSSDWAEAHQSKINIQDINAATFKALIEFIYCDEVKLSEDLALDLLGVSDKYALYDLKHICEEVLAKKISLENFVSRAKISDLFEALILRQAIVEFGIKNMMLLQEKKELNDLPTEFFIEIIMKLQGKVSKLEDKVKALNKKFYEK